MKLVIPPALKHRRYAMLWSGMLISMTGSQMQLWSIYWHIRTLTDQPIAVSGIGLARSLPIFAFALLGGLIADSLNRRKVMLVTQTTMTVCALGLGLLTWFGHIQLWHIYLITAIQAAALSFDAPARQSLIPNLVSKDDLSNAFSMNSIAQNTGAIIGPALSGLVISLAGQQFTYLINAVSFLAVIAALFLMGPVDQEARVDTHHKIIAVAPIREGIQFIFRQPIILSTMLLDFFASFFASANTLLPFVARDILKVGAVPYGWLSAAQSIGAVGTALIFSQRSTIRRQGKLVLGAVTIFGVSTIVFGISHSFILTMLALIVMGMMDSVSVILRNTIRQLHTPDIMRGRMVSINQIFFSGGPQLGEIESGLVAQFFDVPTTIIVGGVGCIAAVAGIAWRWPQLHRYNGDEPITAAIAPA